VEEDDGNRIGMSLYIVMHIHETEIISVLTIPEVKMVKIISELNL
jgi:hypothetical protein